MSLDLNAVKALRDETGAGVMEVKTALEASNGDVAKAREALMTKVAGKAAKKSDRTCKDGLVVSYNHAGGKIGSLVMLGCETDFVAKTEDFQKLCREIAMQVCTQDFADVAELADSEYIRDSSKKIQDLINEVIAKVGEKIELQKFVKFKVGE